jgi:hypothetical protein
MKRANVIQWPPASLDQWLSEACQVSTFTDAHVDDIDEQWQPKDRWIEAGCTTIKAAINIVRSKGSKHRIAVSYALVDQTVFSNIQTSKQFEIHLNHTPPSLYVAAPGSEPWLSPSPTMEAVVIPASVTRHVFPCELNCEGLLVTYRPPNSEAVQSVWFIARA